MEKIQGYETTQGFTGEFETIKLGGHVCKVLNAKVETVGNRAEQLVIAYDIEKGENKGYFKRQFDQDTRPDKKWKGIHRIFTKDLEGNCNKFLKGFITSVEDSNNGYKWDWNEETLKNKLFGGVFGRKQYTNASGELKFFTELRWVRKTEGIEGVDVPEDKLIKTQNAGGFYPMNENIEDDDLPF